MLCDMQKTLAMLLPTQVKAYRLRSSLGTDSSFTFAAFSQDP